MIEALKHTLGICGEHWHPNIWTVLAGGTGFSLAFNYIKVKVKEITKKNSNDT